MMTIPHQMNCYHREDGWCLHCVRREHDERQDEIAALKARIAELEDEQRWIPVSEETYPESGKEVICVWCGSFTGTAIFNHDGTDRWFSPGEDEEVIEPTHWRPLPEPPKLEDAP